MYRRLPQILIGMLLLSFPLMGQTPEWQTAVMSEKPVYYEAVGTIQPRMTSTLSSKVMGNVLEVLKREGDLVKAGEVVLKIDAKDIASDLASARAGLSEAAAMLSELEKGKLSAQAQIEQVEANLKMAESTYSRIKSLFEKKSVSRQEFEQAETAVNSVRAQLRSAEAQRSGLDSKRSGVVARMSQAEAGIAKVQTMKNLAEVSSPFSGRIVSRKIEPGMLAAPGVPLMIIEDDSHHRFEAVVPESLISGIQDGASVTVVVDALGNAEFEGQVAEVAPTGDALSHTFVVKIAVPGEPRFKTGMYARGRFERGLEKSLLVPKTAIEFRGQLEGVWAEQDGQARYRLVRIGRDFGDQVEILSGLKEKERFLLIPPSKGSEKP